MLAGGEADLALGHGEARDAVHQAEDVAAAVAEILCDRQGGVGGLAADRRRLVGGGEDDDAARKAVGAEGVLDELARLAAALADQADDHDLGGAVAGHHRQQGRLPHSGAGEDPHPLAAAAGDEGVHGADAEVDLAGDPLTAVGGWR